MIDVSLIAGKYQRDEAGLLHGNLTRSIIGCSMRVHSAIGNGFQEVIYQRALAIELCDAGIEYIREKEVDIWYKERNIGTRRADFIIEGIVLVELKAQTCLDTTHFAQTLNYLKAYEIKLGLLINFGGKSLEWKRVIHTDLNTD